MTETEGVVRFGRYEILGTLGQGGFAVVYRARDPMLGREVALKALLPHLASDGDVRRRFLAEAQALARLHHPNIVTVHDVGETDGRPFFAMELIEGRTLAEVGDGRALPAGQVIEIMRGLCSAVDTLHAADLVHRDIKGANIMLDRSGRVVLMDFGIARALGRTQQTRTGASLGTVETMAPEQIRGQPVGPAADIYALGVLTYQLLAGRLPFAGDTAYVLHAHVYEPPPPLRELRPGLPAAIYNAVDAALAKDPASRPVSAGAFAAALAGVPTAPVTPSWPRPAEAGPPAEHARLATPPSSEARPARPSNARPRSSSGIPLPAAIGGGIAIAAIAVAIMAGLLLHHGGNSKSTAGAASAHAVASTQVTAAASVAGAASARAAPATPAPTATPAPKPAFALAPPEKQVLNIPVPEPDQLDPQRAAYGNDTTIIKQLYRGLLSIDASDPNKVVAAAAQIPSSANGGISADGKTYTLHLRNGLKWQDGSPLTARDFEYGIKRLFDPALASDYASFYFNIAGAKEYAGAAGAAPADLARLRDAVGVKATNDSTLVITLLNPQPSFNTLLTLWPVFPVQQAQIDKYGDKAFAEASNIVGDGPFQTTEWVHSDHITLSKNPNYWGDDQPALARIVMKNETDVIAAYKNGDIDLTPIPDDAIAQIGSDPVLSKESVVAATQATFGIEFNVTRPPFDDVNVRHAFSEALDRDAYVKSVAGGAGTAAYSLLPPGVPDYDPGLGLPYRFDPAKAKADLARSRYGANLPPVTLIISSLSTQGLRDFLQNQLQTNLGINVTVQALDDAEYTSRYHAGDFQATFAGWVSDYSDPEDWIPQVFGSGAGDNKTSYSNPRVDQLIADARSAADNQRRLDDYKQAQAIIVDDMPEAFFYYGQTHYLLKPYVRGLRPTPVDGLPGDWFLTGVAIDSTRP